MKTASLPSLRVAPELREAAESVLAEGETLSGFIQQSVERAVATRRLQAEFLARGQASLDEYRRTGVSYSADEVMTRLQAKIERKRKQLQG